MMKTKMYFQIYSTLVSAIFIIMISLSTILYYNFTKVTLNRIYEENLTKLMDVKTATETMQNVASLYLNQLASDPFVQQLFYSDDLDTYQLQSSMNQLAKFNVGMSLVDSIYVYNRPADKIYVASTSLRDGLQNSTNLDDSTFLDLFNHESSLGVYKPIPRKLSFVDNVGRTIEEYCFTFLYYDSLINTGEVNNIIAINVSEEWIHQFMNNAISSDFVVIDRNGTAVSNSPFFTMGENYNIKAYIQTLLGSDENGYFTSSIDGEKMLISYTATDTLGWQYLSLTPYNEITKDIKSIQRYTLVVTFIILILGLLLSMIASNNLYNPFVSLNNQLKSLQLKKNEHDHGLQMLFLRRLLLGKIIKREKTICEQAALLSVPITPKGFYLVAILMIDNYSDYLKNHDSIERSDIKDHINSLSQQQLAHTLHLDCLCVDLLDNQFALIVHDANSSNLENSDCQNAFLTLQTMILHDTGISVTIALSTMGYNMEELSILYKEASNTALYRLVYGHKSLLLVNTVLDLSLNDYKYPSDKEDKLQNNLLSGNSKKAKEIYTEIRLSIMKESYSVINMVLSRLSFVVYNAVITIQKNNNIETNISMNQLYTSISQSEVIEEIDALFFELFENVQDSLEKGRSNKHEHLQLEINNLIAKQLSDNSLSLDSIADQLHMSPTYLNRLYKQSAYCSIPQSILQYRMAKAREYLSETDWTVKRIAMEIGFTSDSYFYKVFKKENGATPDAFRRTNYKDL